MGCRLKVRLKCEGKDAACVGWRLKVEVHVEDRGELEVGGVDLKWDSSVRAKGPRVGGGGLKAEVHVEDRGASKCGV